MYKEAVKKEMLKEIEEKENNKEGCYMNILLLNYYISENKIVPYITIYDIINDVVVHEE